MSDLNSTRLRELVSYDATTGIFTWRISRRGGGTVAGAKAGGSHCRGYETISVDNRRYLAHRLAWLYVYGAWPQAEIDHINCVRNDNRIANLRECTHAQNHQNKRVAIGRVGLLGASYSAERGLWESQIKLQGRRYFLGRFPTQEEAHEAYVTAKRKLHEFGTL